LLLESQITKIWKQMLQSAVIVVCIAGDSGISTSITPTHVFIIVCNEAC
jgi:hypothetical protein